MEQGNMVKYNAKKTLLTSSSRRTISQCISFVSLLGSQKSQNRETRTEMRALQGPGMMFVRSMSAICKHIKSGYANTNKGINPH
jgi:hypothetical protein